MPKLKLSFVSAFNERVQPLMDGSAQPEGLDLVPTYPRHPMWVWLIRIGLIMTFSVRCERPG